MQFTVEQDAYTDSEINALELAFKKVIFWQLTNLKEFLRYGWKSSKINLCLSLI